MLSSPSPEESPIEMTSSSEFNNKENIDTLLSNLENPEFFSTQWLELRDKIRLEDILNPIKNKYYYSILWKVACAAERGFPQGFNAIWDKYSEQMKLKDLLTPVEAGDKGITVLWILANAATIGHLEPFNAVLK